MVTMTHMSVVPFAFGSTDRKILSGTVCQAEKAQDHENLRYMARGVQAIGKDVEVVCPITRDSSESKIQFVDVRYQRGSALPVQGQPSGQFKGKFKGEFFTCSNLANGNAQCASADADSSATNDPTSVHIETGHLPHTQDNYYAYKSVIPKEAILKSITYVEDTR